MKHLILMISFIIILTACRYSSHEDDGATDNNLSPAMSFYVGTYTGDTGSNGIYKGYLYSGGKLGLTGLAAQTDNPSFLALSKDNKFILAVNEEAPAGSLESYMIEGDSLVRISRSESGGAHPCFVSTGREGYVLTANYTSGTVGLLKMNSEGELGALQDVKQHTGRGKTERQEGPHAHSVYFDIRTQGILSADLGTDEIWIYELDTVQNKLIAPEISKVKMEDGAGPRHLAFHPGGEWIYSINELNSTVTILKRTTEGLEPGPSVSTLPDEYQGPNYCADIHLTGDGRFLYASNRGHNSIAIFTVDQENGSIKLKGHQESGGEWPRNFALSPCGDFLLVANQYSNNIVSFRRDSDNGLIEPVDTISIFSPVCILFKQGE